VKGEKLGGMNFRHPLAHVDAGYDRLSPVYLADYATADDGTGIVHSSPAYGLDDFNSCVAHGMKVDDILNPVQGHGSYAADFPLFGGLNIWKAVPASSRRCATPAASSPPSPSRTATRTAGATRAR
jgi:isoleucyl-tRNA synthetase